MQTPSGGLSQERRKRAKLQYLLSSTWRGMKGKRRSYKKKSAIGIGEYHPRTHRGTVDRGACP